MHKHMVGLHPIMDPVHLGYYRRAMGFRSRVKKKTEKSTICPTISYPE